jgi:predicted CXXCH cytochrome family protein
MQNLELILFLLIGSGTAGMLLLAARRWSRWRYAFLLVPLFCLACAVTWMPSDIFKQEILQQIPTIGQAEFAGSDQCRSCHLSHYDSWHDSYHRSMTQLPSRETVLAPFDGQVLDSGGVSCTVHREGDVYFVDMPDPDWEATEYPSGVARGQTTNAPRVRLPVVMTTGSHHLQAYWVPSEHGNKLRIFPYVYQIALGRWIPNSDSFISPPDRKRYPQIWNNNCVQCHSVAGEVGYEPGNWQTRVAELGIACEACHGPGKAHVAQHSNPLTRYAQRWSVGSDPTIVNPARLTPQQSSQVCGQCHTAFDSKVATPKNAFRPGAEFHQLFTMADENDPSFWRDGSMRIGGREFSGMSQSACYLKGEMSCLSCHSMHASNPDKQMRPEMLGDHACTQCHAEKAVNSQLHTHHAADSEGSRCFNCHMPHSSYALFKGIRSHRIDSPSAASSVMHGRPNACNQCHVDQTLAWTAEHLKTWFDIEPVPMSDEEKTVAASLLWMLRGDAIQRVLAAWTLGWEPSRQASGNGWQTPFLAQLLDDPYSMTRFIAHDSLKQLGVEVADFDFLTSPDERAAAAPPFQNSFQFQKSEDGRLPAEGVKPFIGDKQTINRDLLNKLLLQRDDRPITLNE